MKLKYIIIYELNSALAFETHFSKYSSELLSNNLPLLFWSLSFRLHTHFESSSPFAQIAVNRSIATKKIKQLK